MAEGARSLFDLVRDEDWEVFEEMLLEDSSQVNMKAPNKDTPLHMVAAASKDQLMVMLLERGADMNARNSKNLTPLHYAALHKKNQWTGLRAGECVRLILKRMGVPTEPEFKAAVASVKEYVMKEWGVIHPAVEGAFDDIMNVEQREKELLRLEKSLSGKEQRMVYDAVKAPDGAALVHLLACGAPLQAFQWMVDSEFLDRKSIFYYVDENNWSVLQHAIRKNRADIVDYILDYRNLRQAEMINHVDDNGESALSLAVNYGSVGIVSSLLRVKDTPPNRDALNSKGQPLIHGALSTMSMPFEISEEKRESNQDECIVLLLGQKGGRAPADLSVVYQGGTFVHHMIRRKRVGVLDNVLGAKAPLDSRDEMGRNPLHMAALMSDVHSANLLLEYGAGDFLCDVDTIHGYTPFLTACAVGDINTLSVLAGPDGADEESCPRLIKDLDGNSAMMVAAKERSAGDKVAKTLFSIDSRLVTAENLNGELPQHAAAKCGNHVFIDFLLDAGADPNVLDNDQRTALHHLTMGHNLKDEDGNDAPELSGDSVDEWNQFSEEDVHVRASSKCLDSLLAHGTDADAVDSEGNSSLHYAAISGDRNAVVKLLEKGVDADAKNKEGVTPRDFASLNGHSLKALNLYVTPPCTISNVQIWRRGDKTPRDTPEFVDDQPSP